jgi:hypothetical protein
MNQFNQDVALTGQGVILLVLLLLDVGLVSLFVHQRVQLSQVRQLHLGVDELFLQFFF